MESHSLNEKDHLQIWLTKLPRPELNVVLAECTLADDQDYRITSKKENEFACGLLPKLDGGFVGQTLNLGSLP